MLRLFVPSIFTVVIAATFAAAQPVPAPVSKIKPGEVNVPVGKGEQQLIIGELISLDVKARTGSFRFNDKVRTFTALPYAQLMLYAGNCDLSDFRIGERALFRLHQDAEGKWTWLTYIGDDSSFLKNHSSYLWVDALDAAKGEIRISRGNATRTQWGEKDVLLKTNADTKYWKAGKAASFKDIKVGDKLRTRTGGVGDGNGKTRVCWDVFLDDESLTKFQDNQKAIHAKRMETDGLTGYIDGRDGKTVRLTLFIETRFQVKNQVKSGQKVRLAPAGFDRIPTAQAVNGTITQITPVKMLHKVVVTLDAPADNLAPPSVVRVWLEK